jgi:hypothetical protein
MVPCDCLIECQLSASLTACFGWFLIKLDSGDLLDGKSDVQQIALMVIDRSGPFPGACRVSRGRVRKVSSQALSLNVCFEAKKNCENCSGVELYTRRRHLSVIY